MLRDGTSEHFLSATLSKKITVVCSQEASNKNPAACESRHGAEFGDGAG